MQTNLGDEPVWRRRQRQAYEKAGLKWDPVKIQRAIDERRRRRK